MTGHSPEWHPQVHVAHVVVDGVIKGPRTVKYNKPDQDLLLPDAIADTYWHLHAQDKCVPSCTLQVCARKSLLPSMCVPLDDGRCQLMWPAFVGAAGPRSWTCGRSQRSECSCWQ